MSRLKAIAEKPIGIFATGQREFLNGVPWRSPMPKSKVSRKAVGGKVLDLLLHWWRMLVQPNGGEK